jgi:hypothetical protein
MKFAEFQSALHNSTVQSLEIRLPEKHALASHFHVTEVGRVTKDFVDCGGVRRTETTVVLQTLVAHDTDHRLSVSKMAGILSKSATLALGDELPVDIEIQGSTIETWRVASMECTDDQMVIHVEPRRTACLAPEICQLNILPTAVSSCCDSPSGCG